MTKKRGRLNLVDIVVIAVILLALLWLGYTLVKGLGGTGDSRTVTYVLEIPNVRSELAGKAAEGDSVYDSESGKSLGRISGVSVAPQYYTGTDGDGEPVNTKMNNYNVLYITVEAKATRTSAGYTAADRLIAVGERYKIRTPGFYGEGECVSVKTAEELSGKE